MPVAAFANTISAMLCDSVSVNSVDTQAGYGETYTVLGRNRTADLGYLPAVSAAKSSKDDSEWATHDDAFTSSK